MPIFTIIRERPFNIRWPWLIMRIRVGQIFLATPQKQRLMGYIVQILKRVQIKRALRVCILGYVTRQPRFTFSAVLFVLHNDFIKTMHLKSSVQCESLGLGKHYWKREGGAPTRLLETNHSMLNQVGSRMCCRWRGVGVVGKGKGGKNTSCTPVPELFDVFLRKRRPEPFGILKGCNGAW